LHIQRVEIRNIRGFREVDLDLTRPDGSFAGWTVLAGLNGSGKSTLLKAIALALAGPEIARTLQESFANWIRTGEQEAAVTTWLALTMESLPEAEPWGLDWKLLKTGREPKLTGDDNWTLKTLGTLGNDLDEWFTAAYGPYRRLSGHAADAQRLMAGPPPLARLVSLFREDASLVEGTVWLREMYLKRLEGDIEAAHAEQTLIRLLNDGLLPGSVRIESVDSSGLKVRTPDAELPLTELSDGYRTVAALVIDIVRHLHHYFEPLIIEEVRDEHGTCLKVLHEGVVLIDEVELHLHVSWQKRIGFWLKRHFPNIQFIVTTHSPFVCQAADPRGLIRLPAPGEDRPVEHVSEELYYTVVNGSADDAVMTELFGLETPYSKESEKLRDEVAHLEARLQTGKATAEEEKELVDLRSQLPQTPTGNIEQLLRKLTVDA
jgi:AAA domain, putative AbiEii toxin, Type IV TA system/AAA domain